MPTIPTQWFRIWLCAIAITIAGLVFNEVVLRAAGQPPSVTSDTDLFCAWYRKIDTLTAEDVILLGTSRMQAGFDLATFHQIYPERQVIQLAQYGGRSSFKVFEDIVLNTDFAGTVLIDETESTLISDATEQGEIVAYCHDNYSLNRHINRLWGTFLQRRFVSLSQQGNSFRLWTHLVRGKLPDPTSHSTTAERSVNIDFAFGGDEDLADLRESRLQALENDLQEPSLDLDEWLEQTSHWKASIQRFQGRGGKVIFVRLPVDLERWAWEKQIYPPDRYWESFSTSYQVNALHFADYPAFQNYYMPDTSHMDVHDRGKFTADLLAYLDLLEYSSQFGSTP